MRALLQRVSRARIAPVEAPERQLAAIGKGVVILVGFEASDTLIEIEQMVQKIKNLRFFSDADGKLNLSGAAVGAEYLLVSQFTLYATCKYGSRPSFDLAAPKAQAQKHYEFFVAACQRILGPERVQNGVFGSDLGVELVNDGPVTLWLDSKEVL